MAGNPFPFSSLPADLQRLIIQGLPSGDQARLARTSTAMQDQVNKAMELLLKGAGETFRTIWELIFYAESFLASRNVHAAKETLQVLQATIERALEENRDALTPEQWKNLGKKLGHIRVRVGQAHQAADDAFLDSLLP